MKLTQKIYVYKKFKIYYEKIDLKSVMIYNNIFYYILINY